MADGGSAALLGEGASPALAPHDICFRRPDGSDLWAHVSASRIVDEAGQPAGMLAMVTDVSQRRHDEARRTLLEGQLRQSQKMEAIGTLAGGIAHDFNNILAAILGNVALAQQDLRADHSAQPRLQQIAQAGARARSLVQQIVAFSRQQPQAW
jgi:signal transduction histidine kinase